MIDCTCGYGKNISEDQKRCPNCGIDVTPLHRIRGLPRSYRDEANMLAQHGLLDVAMEKLMAAICLDGGSVSSYVALGELYIRKGLYREAITAFEKALQIEPRNTGARKGHDESQRAIGKAKASVLRKLSYSVAVIVMATGIVVSAAFGYFAFHKVPANNRAADPVVTMGHRFAEDPNLRGADLSVRRNGNEITISGEVPSELHKALVTEIAQRLGGERAVLSNNISVRRSPSLADRPAGFMYTIRRGDTLVALSQKFYGSSQEWNRIVSANKGKISDPRTLGVGEGIFVPSR
jgi:nucleoid-associated protein YgaU